MGEPKNVEVQAIESFTHDLCSVIIDPDIFASLLVQNSFLTKRTADNKMPLGISDFSKTWNLLGVVIRKMGTDKQAEEKFTTFLRCVLSNRDLGLENLAERMEDRYREFNSGVCAMANAKL